MPIEEDQVILNMRKERNTYSSVYMQFTQMEESYFTHAFCFYEGEDGKYYDSRLRREFGNKFFTFRVGNKVEVLKLLKAIKKDYFDIFPCLMFFVDRDFDFDTIIQDEDLYVTPCYSVENLYVSSTCLERILQTEFLINSYENDYKKCLEDFKCIYHTFNQLILEFNAIKYIHDMKSHSNSDYDFSNKNTKFIRFELSKSCLGDRLSDMILLAKSKDYQTEINKMLVDLDISQSELQEAKDVLSDKLQKSRCFRGKNQLCFFTTFIYILRQLNKNSKYFEYKRDCVHISPSGNWLSELSQYADEPDSLIKFINDHKTKLDLIGKGKR